MSRRTCDEPGCDNPHHAKGKCKLHYERRQQREWQSTRRDKINARQRERLLDPERRAKHIAAVRADQDANPEKYAARTAVRLALSAGRLVRPDRCEACGLQPCKPHAHHDDYNKPLQVRWLCSTCHGKEHHT